MKVLCTVHIVDVQPAVLRRLTWFQKQKATIFSSLLQNDYSIVNDIPGGWSTPTAPHGKSSPSRWRRPSAGGHVTRSIEISTSRRAPPTTSSSPHPSIHRNTAHCLLCVNRLTIYFLQEIEEENVFNDALRHLIYGYTGIIHMATIHSKCCFFN